METISQPSTPQDSSHESSPPLVDLGEFGSILAETSNATNDNMEIEFDLDKLGMDIDANPSVIPPPPPPPPPKQQKQIKKLLLPSSIKVTPLIPTTVMIPQPPPQPQQPQVHELEQKINQQQKKIEELQMALQTYQTQLTQQVQLQQVQQVQSSTTTTTIQVPNDQLQSQINQLQAMQNQLTQQAQLNAMQQPTTIMTPVPIITQVETTPVSTCQIQLAPSTNTEDIFGTGKQTIFTSFLIDIDTLN